jgi:TatD DNase family protein
LSISHEALPQLDCHAHVAVDVTETQVRALGETFVFAVTRSLAEAERAPLERFPHLVWGCGVHPGDRTALDTYDEGRFRQIVARFSLIGEIGLDARAGDVPTQYEILKSILGVVGDLPVVCSIHSAGCAPEVVALLAEHPVRGPILHWFTGKPANIALATELGCSFSVNTAMTDEQILALPRNHVLPETDFPVANPRNGAKQPGDTLALEERLARLWSEPRAMVRVRLFQNLRELAVRSGTLDRFPDPLADAIVAA